MVTIFSFDHMTDENREYNPSEKYLDVFLYDRNIMDFPRKYSLIFLNSRKRFGNDCLAFGQLLENLRKVFGNCKKSRQFVAACR